MYYTQTVSEDDETFMKLFQCWNHYTVHSMIQACLSPHPYTPLLPQV